VRTISAVRTASVIAVLVVLAACLPAPHTGLNRAGDLYRQGRYQDAVTEYRRVIDMRPSWSPPYLGLGNSLWALGDRQQAVRAYQDAVRLSPAWSEALLALGGALVELNRSAEAVPILSRAVEIAPTDSAAKELLARARRLSAGTSR
jgi:tetratricopeptide (TPR) repeat protein